MAAERLEPFFCGGTAAMFSAVCIHPIDLAKVRMQLATNSAAKTASGRASSLLLVRHMIQTEGVKSIYSGVSAAVMRQLTYGTTRIGLHQVFSDALRRRSNNQDIPFYQKVAAGMAGGAIASCVGTPFDVGLVRMQADTLRPLEDRRNYNHVFDAIGRVAKEEGVSCLWRGLVPVVLRGMVMNAGMMATYDQAIQMVRPYFEPHNTSSVPSMPSQLCASIIGGFFCSVTSLPFDMLKSRLQDMKPDLVTGKLPYKNVGDCAMKILRKEGLFFFWRGFVAYFSRSAPNAMIILLAREQIKKRYRMVTGLSDTME